MDCRHIDEAEVKDVLANGKLDASRTRHDGKCSSYAVEKPSNDGQDLRIVFANCPREVKVVTTIDTSGNYKCDCR